MIAHELKIGQRIYDELLGVCGTILFIGGENKDMDISVEEADTIVTYKVDNTEIKQETTADMVYPKIENETFGGEEVFLEINKSEDFCYDYFCPKRGENLFDFELD